MQKFLVPQFIDIEPKIFGPVTVRQFIILMVSVLLSVIFYKLLSFLTFVILALLTVGFAVVLSFVKINGAHFHIFLLNILQMTKKPNLRVWNKRIDAQDLKYLMKKKPKDETEVEEIVIKKSLKTNRLSQLSLIINTGGVYQGNDELWEEEKYKSATIKIKKEDDLNFKKRR